MNKEIIIAPSVLSLDYSKMEQQIRDINASKAKWLHFDVMDGHFVKNLTFGPDILKGFDKSCPLYMDVHLMVQEPDQFVEPFARSGADLITFHVEALNNDIDKIRALIDKIHSLGLQAGISLRPSTPIEQFEPILDDLDLVLVMSVEPGFGGQAFMPDQLEKIQWLKNRQNSHHYKIEIDGGINDKTGKLAVENGADVLVAGSYIFKQDVDKAVDSLLEKSDE